MNLSAQPGSDAVFSCKAKKQLAHLVTWIRVTGQGDVLLEEGTEVLRIKNVTQNDQVRNSDGKVLVWHW